MFWDAASTGLLGLYLLYASTRYVNAVPAAVPDTAANAGVEDVAPDYSKDKFPPYPTVTNPDGSTVQNLRGVRLYGWKGCGVRESKDVAQAYDDFYTLAQQPELYKDLAWDDPATKEFFGPDKGVNRVTDVRRKQIKQIFEATQQVYYWRIGWEPPWIPNIKSLWIEVRCSGGDETGDPDNVCGDRRPNDGTCPRRPDGSPGNTPPDGDNRMEAWSNPSGKYSQITFCSKFFNDLQPLQEVIDAGKKKPQAVQNYLDTWNNRARCFFHEVTHLTYFMNTPGQGPSVEDLTVKYKEGRFTQTDQAYGPYNVKLLRNYVKKGMGGFYTQRNADTYAFFALAKYVTKQIGRYPHLPNPGSKKPIEAPRDPDGEPIVLTDADMMIDPKTDMFVGANPDDDLLGKEELDAASQKIQGFSTPHCPDNYPNLASGSSTTTPPKQSDPQCDDKGALSGIPYNVFHGGSVSIYDGFCKVAAQHTTRELTWTVDAHGKQKTPTRKRTPPPNPDAYKTSNFELTWTPNLMSNANKCSRNCRDAFAAIASSPCGHQGGEQNVMTAAGSVDVGCGTYRYKITGPNMPKLVGARAA